MELLQNYAQPPAVGTYAHFANGARSLPPKCVFDTQRTWLSSEAQYCTHAAHNPIALMTYRIHAPLARQLLAQLDAGGVNASLITTQYAPWALRARGRDVLLRLTPHYFSTDAEIVRLRAVLAALPVEFRLRS
jgi:selenocysteine lyase/cysteine desulfurase